MKKFVAMLMTVVMLTAMLAACGAAPAEPTAPAVEIPASSLEILETIWAAHADSEKFPIYGGNVEANIMDAPGSYDMTYAENMTYTLLVPADRIADVAEAASMIHMMNANTFTCGVFRLAEGVSAADFGAAMQQAVQGNMWMCGFPEKLLVLNFSDAYVLVAFGLSDVMTTFEGHATAAYPGVQALYNEAIG